VDLIAPGSPDEVVEAIAAAASSPRRLSVGPVRDLVLELELVTGTGRQVRAGGRTVKNVSGYDLCRLFTGSLRWLIRKRAYTRSAGPTGTARR